MKKLFLKISQGDPIVYNIKEKEWDIIFIDFKSCTIWASVVFNGTLMEKVPYIIAYVFNKMIKPTGKIILRMDMPELHNKKGGDKLNLLLHKLIEKDCLEFMAQCVLRNSKIPAPIVKNLLVGISKKKDSQFKKKVRFISVPDKLEIKSDIDWPLFDGMPFCNDIIYKYPKYAYVSNSNISELHPWYYLPLNSFKDSNSVELGSFMELTPSSIKEEVNQGINFEKFLINDVKKFDLFQSYIESKKEKFAEKNRPYYLRRIINESSILFYTKYDSGIKSLLFLNPEHPIFINRPITSNIEHYSAIQVKQEWKAKVDIEFIYLETMKSEFLSQFYYYNSTHNSTLTLKSSTILRAKIKKLPPIEVQKEIVKKEKEKLFCTQENKIALHKKLLNFEKEKIAMEQRLSEYHNKMLALKKEIVNNSPALKKTIHSCKSLIPSRKEEAINILYDILPVKKCIDENTPCSTAGFGNKARIIIECVMHTLKANNVIPSWYDNGSSITYISRKDLDWSDQIPENFRNTLQEVKNITNKYSHKGAETPPDEAQKVVDSLIQLLNWMDRFLKNNSDLSRNFQQWVKDDEQETLDGHRKRSGVIGVIANEWLNKQGKKKGAWIMPFRNQEQLKTGDRISISQEFIDTLGLGLGSIVKVDALKLKYGWVSTKIEIINDCPKNFVLSSPLYYPIKGNNEYSKIAYRINQ